MFEKFPEHRIKDFRPKEERVSPFEWNQSITGASARRLVEEIVKPLQRQFERFCFETGKCRITTLDTESPGPAARQMDKASDFANKLDSFSSTCLDKADWGTASVRLHGISSKDRDSLFLLGEVISTGRGLFLVPVDHESIESSGRRQTLVKTPDFELFPVPAGIIHASSGSRTYSTFILSRDSVRIALEHAELFGKMVDSERRKFPTHVVTKCEVASLFADLVISEIMNEVYSAAGNETEFAYCRPVGLTAFSVTGKHSPAFKVGIAVYDSDHTPVPGTLIKAADVIQHYHYAKINIDTFGVPSVELEGVREAPFEF